MKVREYCAGILMDEQGATYMGTDHTGIVMNDETGECFVVSTMQNYVPTEILPMGPMDRMFYDLECEAVVPEWDMVYIFAHLKATEPDEHPYDFEQYIRNCTTGNGFMLTLEQAMERTARDMLEWVNDHNEFPEEWENVCNKWNELHKHDKETGNRILAKYGMK